MGDVATNEAHQKSLIIKPKKKRRSKRRSLSQKKRNLEDSIEHEEEEEKEEVVQQERKKNIVKKSSKNSQVKPNYFEDLIEFPNYKGIKGVEALKEARILVQQSDKAFYNQHRVACDIDPKNTLPIKSKKLKNVDFDVPHHYLSQEMLKRILHIVDDEPVSSMMPIDDRDLRHSIAQQVSQQPYISRQKRKVKRFQLGIMDKVKPSLGNC